MKAYFTLVLFLVSIGCTTIPKTEHVLDGLDTFGSKRISTADISRQYGSKINDWVLATKKQRSESHTLKKQIETSIIGQYGFAFVNLSLITYFAPNPGNYVTVDIVEPADVNRRMAFLPEPQGHFEDPAGLIALWDEYLKLAFELQFAGKIEHPKTCPVWHCTHGFENPRLAPFLEKFNQLVPLHESNLSQILKEDKRPQFRANAAFLLAHIKNGQSLRNYVLGAVSDSSELVRNNAVRVLLDLALRHPALDVPIEPILKVLNYPTTTDRNKAANTLVPLSLKEENKGLIKDEVGRILLEMLKLKQPNNHDPAYAILKNISGLSYGEHDHQAWEGWLKTVEVQR